MFLKLIDILSEFKQFEAPSEESFFIVYIESRKITLIWISSTRLTVHPIQIYRLNVSSLW